MTFELTIRVSPASNEGLERVQETIDTKVGRSFGPPLSHVGHAPPTMLTKLMLAYLIIQAAMQHLACLPDGNKVGEGKPEEYLVERVKIKAQYAIHSCNGGDF